MVSPVAMIKWFDRLFPVKTAILLRHPIAVARSVMHRGWGHACWDYLLHKWFVECELTGRQVDLARKILAGSDELAHHVLDWTLKMMIPIKKYMSAEHPDWTLLTYEECVLDPNAFVSYIARRLDLPEPQNMLDQVARASRSVTPETAGQLANPEYLLERWRRDVEPDQERELLEILDQFEVLVYVPGRNLAINEIRSIPIRPGGSRR